MPASTIAALSRLLDEALALPPAARGAWLAGLPPAQAALAAALRRALARIEDGTAGDAASLRPRLRAARDDAPPGHVGPYRLLEPLGRGGMGEVWLAERADGAFTRQVALKLPHPALLSPALRERFARERDILAALSHPHIARFLDAGVDGERPWLAMEWVEGRPITVHAQAQALDVRARLRLFGQVLDAVAHAHRRLVAHRDLKPSNILVTADGQAKLLDFGIAKLLDAQDAGAASTALTHAGGRVFTPAYAAPEQLAGEPVTTAVDLYSLGLVLYELLAGRPPFEAGRRLAPVEAPPASARVPASHPQAAALRRALRGDLDAILARALEADPARRYASAEAFAADLRRVLTHEPVEARRAGWLARGAKFVRRHRVESALGAALAFSVLAGVGAIVRADAQARAAARRAEIGEARERATREFLVGVFKASDPRVASDRPRGAITARELLDIGARRIDARFADDPGTRIAMLGLLAEIYEELDENARFGELAKAQTALARAHYGELHPVTLDCLLRAADDAINRGALDEAGAGLAALDGMLHRAGADETALRGYWWFLRATVLQADAGQRARAEQALARAEAVYAAHAPDDARRAYVLSAQGNFVHAAGDDRAAAGYLRRSLAILERQSDRDDGALSTNYSNLGKMLANVGDFGAAEAAHAQAVRLAEATYGRDAWPWWVAAAARADAAHRSGDRRRAEALYAELRGALPPADHHFRNMLEENGAARAREGEANRLVAEGRPEPALALYAQARTGFAHATLYGYEGRQVALEIANAEAETGQAARAEAQLRAVLADYEAHAGPDDFGRLAAHESLARALWRLGRLDAAQAQWRRVLADAGGKAVLPVVLAHEGLADAALARHDAPAALSEIQAAEALPDRLTGSRDVRLAPELALTRARVLQESGRIAEARAVARAALESLRAYDPPGSVRIAEAEATVRRME